MDKEKKISVFVDKWNNYLHRRYVLINKYRYQSFKNDCESFGFDIAEGEKICDEYELSDIALYDVFEFTYHLNEFNDVTKLGSLIAYYWNYNIGLFYSIDLPMGDDYKAWFCVALNKLKRLVLNQQSNSFASICKVNLKGDISKRLFESNSNSCLMQELEINEDGTVFFKKYGLDEDSKNNNLIQCVQVHIEPESVLDIFDAIRVFLEMDSVANIYNDPGSWQASIVDKEGKVFNFNGNLNQLCFYNRFISIFIREKLSLEDDVFCFDGLILNYAISNIVFDYKAINTSDGIQRTKHEKLVIDRNKQVIEYSIEDGDYNATYKLDKDVSSFLDSKVVIVLLICNNFDIDKRNRFSDTKRIYDICIDTNRYGTYKIDGYFDGCDFPRIIESFILSVKSKFNSIPNSDIFNNEIMYEQILLDDQYIVCEVESDSLVNRYGNFYLTDDTSIQLDDDVVVPNPLDNNEISGKVIDIYYYDLEDLPKDVNELKYIIRKNDCDEADN